MKFPEQIALKARRPRSFDDVQTAMASLQHRTARIRQHLQGAPAPSANQAELLCCLNEIEVQSQHLARQLEAAHRAGYGPR